MPAPGRHRSFSGALYLMFTSTNSTISIPAHPNPFGSEFEPLFPSKRAARSNTAKEAMQFLINQGLASLDGSCKAETDFKIRSASNKYSVLDQNVAIFAGLIHNANHNQNSKPCCRNHPRPLHIFQEPPRNEHIYSSVFITYLSFVQWLCSHRDRSLQQPLPFANKARRRLVCNHSPAEFLHQPTRRRATRKVCRF